MLKHKGEKGEKKRGEKTEGKKVPGLSFPPSLSRTQKCCNWRGSRQGRCRSLAVDPRSLQQGPGCCWKCWEHCVQWESHTAITGQVLNGKYLHWDSLQGKTCGNYFIWGKNWFSELKLFFPANSSLKQVLTSRGEIKTRKMTFSFRCHFKTSLKPCSEQCVEAVGERGLFWFNIRKKKKKITQILPLLQK